MSDDRPRRKPQVISLDDPDLVVAPEGVSMAEEPRIEAMRAAADPAGAARGSGPVVPPLADAARQPRLTAAVKARRGFRWGALLLSALSLLGGIALSLSFARFVSIALERGDWIGWLSFGLLMLAALSLLAIVARETAGMLRLRRLGRVRRDLEDALARRDARAEQGAIEHILQRLSDRPELKWPLSRLAEHTRNTADPGDLARLVDRDVMPVLDGDARRLVAATARRVSVVTALSPMALVTVGWILAENLRLLRALATLYGGRPGFLGSMRLARMVFTHIVATGGLALTDDLLGQFLGQDLVRRLSRRLGESVFNAALTARVGAAAIEVIRPLPFIETPRIRARDFIGDIVRFSRGGATAEGDGRAKPT